ncbi:lysine--tRNA ligase [Candidatus Gottesmanbacteria bacterium]|nr:lysine--tRNA ligase [Candidatus Gottesmanbacteria bacterium]
MFWADRIAKEIISTKKYKPYWVDDMFTPSGFAHIGSLRGPLVHDLIYRALIDDKVKASSTYIFNDFDPIDGLPPELVNKFKQYLGFPLRLAPSPEPGFDSFADYFTSDFQNVLKNLGVSAKFLSSWNMYHDGKFNEVIKIALSNAPKIQDIYQKVSGSKKREKGWLPLQVICERCGKLGTTRVFAWDGKKVEYSCEPEMVLWAKGCGYRGKVSPFDGNGKLPWKVDWPAHWKVLGVTIEGAGKDHSSAGGSRDIAKELCKHVFQYPNPFNLPYEFFLIGGKKMSSSKGLGLKARDLTSLLPAAVARFLFVRTDFRQTIEFDPLETYAIPDLFDEYDRCFRAYIKGSDENLARAFELSQIGKIPARKDIFLPRFRDVANYLQLPSVDLQKKFAEIKGAKLTADESTILHERQNYAKIWLADYAPYETKIEIKEEVPQEAKNLTAAQRKYLKELLKVLGKVKDSSSLEKKLYEIAKNSGISAKDAFAAIYLPLLGKTSGPKAAPFLLSLERRTVIKRFQEVTLSS